MISGTQPENHTVEEFPTEILKHGKKGFVFSAPLVRGKVTEIEINHQWPVIQSISLFLESSVQSAQFSHSVMSDSLRPHELQHARTPCPSTYRRADFFTLLFHFHQEGL